MTSQNLSRYIHRIENYAVALAERNLMGGTCVNFACTPSKSLAVAGRAVYDARDGEKFGYALDGGPRVDSAAVMTRVREMRALSGSFDAVSVATEAGVDVFLSDARFIGADEIEVDSRRLKFRAAVIASGSSPAIPDVPGLAEAEYLTNETLFELTSLPRRFVCLGGGPVNCELAQALRRLGSEVDVVDHSDRLMSSEPPEACELVAKRLAAEGVRLHLGMKVTKVDGGRKRVTLGDGSELEYDALLVAAGCRVNVDAMGLDAAGVKYTGSGVGAGVGVDDHLRTCNPAIYAVGDVALPEQYTHAAMATAKLAVANALGGAGKRLSDLVIPHCTYTDPEVAQVGLTPSQAEEQGVAIESHRLDLTKVERANIDGEADGFVELYTHEGGHRRRGLRGRPRRRVAPTAHAGGDAEDEARRSGRGDPLLPDAGRGDPASGRSSG